MFVRVEAVERVVGSAIFAQTYLNVDHIVRVQVRPTGENDEFVTADVSTVNGGSTIVKLAKIGEGDPIVQESVSRLFGSHEVRR